MLKKVLVFLFCCNDRQESEAKGDITKCGENKCEKKLSSQAQAGNQSSLAEKKQLKSKLSVNSNGKSTSCGVKVQQQNQDQTAIHEQESFELNNDKDDLKESAQNQTYKVAVKQENKLTQPQAKSQAIEQNQEGGKSNQNRPQIKINIKLCQEEKQVNCLSANQNNKVSLEKENESNGFNISQSQPQIQEIQDSNKIETRKVDFNQMLNQPLKFIQERSPRPIQKAMQEATNFRVLAEVSQSKYQKNEKDSKTNKVQNQSN